MDIMLRDDIDVIQERIMQNMNITDDELEKKKKSHKEWDVFDEMEEEIREREERMGYLPF